MFKKKLITSAITASLMMGIASTSFAATNPFSDVPADSWAYDAVTTLANDGVIDGYPDGTYQGQNTMTRYEMAQIVARAMARTDLEKADKAIVDKLAVEFADELDNLGVRVADLEKKSDNMKWKGELKYKYSQENHDEGKDKRSNKLEFKLEPKAYIGDSDWTANAKIEYTMYPETDSNADGVKHIEHIIALLKYYIFEQRFLIPHIEILYHLPKDYNRQLRYCVVYNNF